MLLKFAASTLAEDKSVLFLDDLPFDGVLTERSDIPSGEPNGKGEYGDCLYGGDDPPSPAMILED